MIFEYLAKYDFRKVVLCHNADVGLKAVIAVHSTALGPACGGLRMWTYASEEEAIMDALRLGRGMTYKYAAAGVNLGGGKAVIIGDPKTQKTEALIRAMGRFIQSLHGEYKTGEDVGTTLDDMELLYQETEHVITLPEYCGGAGNIGPATAFGVQQAMKACAHEVWGSDRLQGRTIAVQGLGAVGWPAVEGLVKEGARVIVADIDAAKVERARRELGVTAVDPAEIHAHAVRHLRPLRARRASSTTEPSPSSDARSCAGAPTTSSPRSVTAISCTSAASCTRPTTSPTRAGPSSIPIGSRRRAASTASGRGGTCPASASAWRS